MLCCFAFLQGTATQQAVALRDCCRHHGGVCGCRCCDGKQLDKQCSWYDAACEKEPPVYQRYKPHPDPVLPPRSRWTLVDITLNGDRIFHRGVMVRDRVLVPAREVFELTGAAVAFRHVDKKITVRTSSEFLVMHVGDTRAVGRDRSFIMELPPQLFRGRVYVPARFVAEYLGAQVMWEQAAQTVDISLPESVRTDFTSF